MYRHLIALARRFHSYGFSIRDSARLAGEDVAPYANVCREYGIETRPSRKFRLNTSL